MKDRDQKTASVWQESHDLPHHAPLNEDVEVDVCVIGGGITGLTAALSLAREGKHVVLIERHRLGSGVTGKTTAHITSSVDADYSTLSKQLGAAAVRDVFDSMSEAIDRIAALVDELGAECDFERVDAWFYAEPGMDDAPVRESHEALKDAGVEVSRLEPSTPLPFPTAQALVLPGQARFHPLRYLAALARAAAEAGVRIHEHTRAHHVSDGKPCTVETADGKTIRAEHLFHATHSPAGISVLQAEMTCSRSYVLAADVGDDVPAGLFFDAASPYRYVRRQTIGGRDLVLIGGADHETGKGEPDEAMRSLERYARERFDVREVVARWSSQVYAPPDGLPYIGWGIGTPRSIVATGFDGDGIVFGTLSAMMGTELILGRPSRWAERYKPARLNAKASAKQLLTKNLEVAKDFVADRLKLDTRAIAGMRPGEGRLARVRGKQLAVFCDEQGKIHARSAICPHLKCVVRWNGFEETWDCPCHGSRFDAHGTVIEGPSMHDLHEAEVEIVDLPSGDAPATR